MPTSSPAPRAVLRAVLTHPEGLPWLQRALPSVPVAALATTTCALLATWQFSGPADDRIVPFVQELTRREGAAQSVAPEAVDAMLRGLLGDEQQLYTIPPVQFTLIQVLIARAIVFGNALGPQQVDVLLDHAEREADELDLSVVSPPRPAVRTPERPRRSHRPALWSGLVAAAAAAVLLTGLVTPGWMLGGSTDTSSAASVMHKLIEARNNNDFETVAALSCRHWSRAEIREIKQRVESQPPARGTLVGTLHIHNDTATQQIRISEGSGRQELATIELSRRKGSWCATNTSGDPEAHQSPPSSPPPAAPSPSAPASSAPPSSTPAEPSIPPTALFQTIAERFLIMIKAGNTGVAEDMLCRHPSSQARNHIRAIIAQHASARIDPAHPPTGSGPDRIYTLQAVPGGGPGALAMLDEDGRVCIYAFDLDMN